MTLALPRWPVAVVLGLALAAAAPAAPAPSGAPDKKAETPAEKINKALDQTGDFILEGTPLPEALEKLAEQAKVNIVIDRFTLLNQLGIDLVNMPGNLPAVNLKLTGVKTRTALRSVLSQYNLGYAVLGDMVLVTTEDMAIHRQLKQRVSLDLDKVPAATALKQLARDTGTNVLLDARVGKEAQAPVTLQVDDVPLDTSVKLVAEMAGLKTVRIGNVLFVTTKAIAQEMRQDPDLQGGQPVGPLSEQQLEMQLQQRELKMLLQQVQPQVVPLPPPLPKD
jgi:hypothetical protein